MGSLGRYGEALVYQYLLKQYCKPNLGHDSASGSTGAIGGIDSSVNSYNKPNKPNKHSSVEWKNQLQESYAPYDLVLKTPYTTNPTNTANPTNNPMKTHFIEVKSSKYDQKNIFEFSVQEMEFMWNMSNRIVTVNKYNNSSTSSKNSNNSNNKKSDTDSIDNNDTGMVRDQYISNTCVNNSLVSYDIYRVCNIPNYTLTRHDSSTNTNTNSGTNTNGTNGVYIVIIRDVIRLLQDQKLKLHMSY